MHKIYTTEDESIVLVKNLDTSTFHIFTLYKEKVTEEKPEDPKVEILSFGIKEKLPKIPKKKIPEIQQHSTSREADIIRDINAGMSTKDIADRYNVGIQVVYNAKAKAKKLGQLKDALYLNQAPRITPRPQTDKDREYEKTKKMLYDRYTKEIVDKVIDMALIGEEKNTIAIETELTKVEVDTICDRLDL